MGRMDYCVCSVPGTGVIKHNHHVTCVTAVICSVPGGILIPDLWEWRRTAVVSAQPAPTLRSVLCSKTKGSNFSLKNRAVTSFWICTNTSDTWIVAADNDNSVKLRWPRPSLFSPSWLIQWSMGQGSYITLFSQSDVTAETALCCRQWQFCETQWPRPPLFSPNWLIQWSIGEGSYIALFSPSDVTAFYRMKYGGGFLYNLVFTEWRHCVSQNTGRDKP